MNRIYINNDWEFSPAEKQEFKVVRIPHTTKELPFNYFDESEYQMECIYRKIIEVPEILKNKRLILNFEAVAHSAEVFINEVKVCEHHCGYTAFKVEITDKVIFGANNILTVKVNSKENQNIPPFGYVVDYMTFGGIYRDVYIEVKNPDYIEDAFVKCEFDKNASPTLVAELKVNMTDDLDSDFYVKAFLSDSDKRLELRKVSLSDVDTDISFSKELEDITLWDIDNPKLYNAQFELYRNDKLVDIYQVQTGFREIEFREDGFYLNRRKVKIRGLNRHQSYPYVGYAMPESMQKNDADILKYELGCNAVRTSHYPQSHYFLERCDELGLLVFTEIPGWQHIGDAEWKKQAVENVKEMVVEYRNHPSIILWGVRINESEDDDEFYKATNKVAHELDSSRPTGGVRCIRKSNLLEDVYTYNDFIHSGLNEGCAKKKSVTSDMNKAYLVSEYNGHMYPTKMFDDEEQRRSHALRHAKVLSDVNAETDIAGSFGWCMFDYNTHQDFGSGDRICYHGVLDMFRNPKQAAYVYASEQDDFPVLELSSSMDIGEHPGCNRGETYIYSNADSVKMYKNGIFIKEYTKVNSKYKNLKHGPMLIDDYIGSQLKDNEGFSDRQAEMISYGLNYTAIHGYDNLSLKVKLSYLWCMLRYQMKPSDAVTLFNKYIGDWGGNSKVYKFEAIKDGQIVKTLIKEPMKKGHLEFKLSADSLIERSSYDVLGIRIKAVDDNGNQLHFYGESLEVKVEGPAEVIGPKAVALRGGAGGLYIKSTGEVGLVKITIGNDQLGYSVIKITAEI